MAGALTGLIAPPPPHPLGSSRHPWTAGGAQSSQSLVTDRKSGFTRVARPMPRRQPEPPQDPSRSPKPKRARQPDADDQVWRAGRVQQWPIDRLRPYARNPRTHSAEQITALAASILRFGFTNPILVDEQDGVVAGHGRLLAAQELGLKKVPVVVLDHLTETERRAYVIADNRLAELAGWDREILAEELCVLEGEGFPVELTGFDEHEIDRLIGEDLENELEVAPAVEDEDAAQAKWKVQKGQLWRIGQHRLLCGDATLATDWARLMSGELATMVFTDPPYGVAYQSSSAKHGAVRGDAQRDVALVDQLLRPSLAHALSFTIPQAGFYIWHAMETREDFAAAMRTVGLVEIDTLIWAKPSASLGMMDYRRDYEPCFYAAKDGQRPRFFGDRTNTTVWRISSTVPESGWVALGAGVIVIAGEREKLYVAAREPDGKGRIRRLRIPADGSIRLMPSDGNGTLWEVARDSDYLHPTQKPVELARRAILNSSEPAGLVLDFFLGSGSTMVAAEQVGRRCFGMEITEKHCAAILTRMEHLGMRPTLV
jgi:ParB-like chromosome segregation protein Spo0J